MRYGYYPVRLTSRQMTPSEMCTVVDGLRCGDPQIVEQAMAAIDVAAGKKVSRVWIISDPVAALVGRVHGMLRRVAPYHTRSGRIKDGVYAGMTTDEVLARRALSFPV